MSPLERIQMIQRSLRCFGLGLVGLLPVVGLPFAIAALGTFVRLNRQARDVDTWNPAGTYFRWGAVFAIWGVLLSLLLVAWISLAVLNH